MPEYRAYIIGSDGHISGRVDLLCEDDSAARNRARELVNGHDIELWQGARKLAQFRHMAARDDLTHLRDD